MSKYIDGFVLPLPKNKVTAYRKMARVAAKVWRDHGALEYFECVGDDLNLPFGCPFPKGIKARRGETIVFAFIVYRSRAHRDRVNAQVMKDPRLNEACDPDKMPFNPKRMLCGGFQVLVEG